MDNYFHKPAYVFRVSPEIALRWTAFSIILFFFTIAGVSVFYQSVHDRPWNVEIQTSSWAGFLGFVYWIAVLFGTLIVHELIHGLAFSAFGGSPRYGVGAKFFLPYAYATSPGDRFPRNHFIVIGLAPLVVIDLVCVVLLAVFPQAAWLGWVIVINTSGAIGDMWLATLLLRCPATIEVEDRREGIAIYTHSGLDRRSLPFTTTRNQAHSALWVWGRMVLIILMVVVLGSFLLPVIFSILQVPSLNLGIGDFQIISWRNDQQGFSLSVHFWSVLIIAAVTGLVGILLKMTITRTNGRK